MKTFEFILMMGGFIGMFLLAAYVTFVLGEDLLGFVIILMAVLMVAAWGHLA